MGKCLIGKNPLTLGDCADPSSYYLEKVDSMKTGTIVQVLDEQCINAVSVSSEHNCQAGVHQVHVYDCPSEPGPADHPADHFHYDSERSVIMSEICVNADLCVTISHNNTAVLGYCNSTAAIFKHKQTSYISS